MYKLSEIFDMYPNEPSYDENVTKNVWKRIKFTKNYTYYKWCLYHAYDMASVLCLVFSDFHIKIGTFYAWLEASIICLKILKMDWKKRQIIWNVFLLNIHGLYSWYYIFENSNWNITENIISQIRHILRYSLYSKYLRDYKN